MANYSRSMYHNSEKKELAVAINKIKALELQATLEFVQEKLSTMR